MRPSVDQTTNTSPTLWLLRELACHVQRHIKGALWKSLAEIECNIHKHLISLVCNFIRLSLRDSLHGPSFRIKWNTFVASRPSFITVCWRPKTTNVRKRVPEWNLLKPQPSFRLSKLAVGVPVHSDDATANANAMQVNALCSSHYQTLTHLTVYRKQVEHDDSLLRQTWVFVE